MNLSVLVLTLLCQTPPSAPPPAPFPPGPGAGQPLGVEHQGSPSAPPPAPSPSGPEAQTVDMDQWDANALPRISERSEQPPLTDEDLTKLTQAGFTPVQLVKLLGERRCTCDASPEGLIRLKQGGVDPSVLQAVSLYALRPNRTLNLEVTLDFSGESRRARNAYLYVFVDDGDLTRVLNAKVDELLRRSNAHETTVDNSDFLISRTVRRIVLPGQITLKNYGRHTMLVASSASPNLTHPSQLKAADRIGAQVYQFDYPRASLQSLCRITVGYRRDVQITDRWRFMGSRFECEWN